MLRIALCDSTIEKCNEISQCVNKILKHEVTISQHTNPFSLVTYINDESRGNIDLLMIALDMEEQNSIDVVESILIKYPHIKIIFIAETMNHVKDIFHISPIYLLIRPIEKKYLMDSLFKTLNLIDESKKDFLVLNAKYGRNGILTIPIKDIYYISSNKRKLEIHELDKTYEINMKLNDLQTKLTNNFLRCHQSYIVNMDKILKISKEEIELFNDIFIPVSRSRNAMVKKIYTDYLNIRLEM